MEGCVSVTVCVVKEWYFRVGEQLSSLIGRCQCFQSHCGCIVGHLPELLPPKTVVFHFSPLSSPPVTFESFLARNKDLNGWVGKRTIHNVRMRDGAASLGQLISDRRNHKRAEVSWSSRKKNIFHPFFDPSPLGRVGRL